MIAILTVLRPLALANTFLQRIGRNAAWVAWGLMVLIIMRSEAHSSGLK